jgi:hypothetical protein
MPLKRIAKLHILAEHIERTVPAKIFEPGRMLAAIHPRGECASLEVVALKTRGLNPVAAARAFIISATAPGGDRLGVEAGQIL